MKTILLIAVLIGIPILIVVDSVLIKWIRININGDQISVQRLFRFRKYYSLSGDLNSWKRIQGYSRFGANGYILILRFNNRDAYQVDSAFGLRQYEELFRALNLKYNNLNDNK